MANQRANIYPIQLQGAELNLNKFDGEIKQYSGFNKNNSPFVGGGLSPIFRKDETVEGATSENTYIAPNGDVYRVDTEGLWKNEEKVIDTFNADFFDIQDLGLLYPDSTVYVYDEETYIYQKNDKFYYHSGKIEHDFLSPYDIVINKYIYYGIKYQILKRNIAGIEYDIVGVFFGDVAYNTDRYLFLNIYKKNNDGNLVNVYSLKLDYTYFSQNTVIDDFPFFSFILKTNGDSLSNFKIAILTGTSYANQTKNNYILRFNGSNITVSSSLSFFFSDGLQHDRLYLDCFRFTQDHAVRCNTVGIVTGVQFKTGMDFKCTYSVDWSNSKLILNETFEGSDFNFIKAPSSRIDVIKDYGIQTVLAADSNTLRNVYSVDDEITTFGHYKSEDTTKLYFNLGSILNGQVLINNRLASGISLPGGMILVSEWNSVDLDYIFFGDNSNEWKENKYVCLWKNINTGNWYKMIKSVPKLKIINNQIIINANTTNSYRITDGKVLLFAPAYNNRRPSFKAGSVGSFNTVYMATSINEYNLKDNCSLLLNPVLVTNGYIPNNTQLLKTDFENFSLNIYRGESEVLYIGSQNIKTKSFLKNDSLNDLSFPSNTDGNVQYSPSLFATEKGKYGNLVFISESGTAYKLMIYDNKAVMSYFLSTAVEGLQDFFTIQGQLYGILDNQIYNFSIVNEVANRGDFVISIEGLQFVGNTPYEALFFSKTNRCLYSFTGANVLNAKQFVDKISEVRNYKYNPATQSIFLITDIGVIVYSLFGIYQIEFLNCHGMYLLNNGVILTNNEGTFKYIKYYKEETTEDYIKENIQLETMFYGMNNQTVTINDCLYMRLFSEEHESGNIEVSAVTLANEGKKTERTTFKIKPGDWDKETHSIYLRYQPKEQRGLGISFKINSPFKICSLSVGSIADSILIDKVSKGAINAPYNNKSSIEEW